MLWLTVAGAWVFITGLLAKAVDAERGVPVRVVAGGVYAGVSVTLLLGFAVALGFAVNLRNARRRLTPGSVWTVTATADQVEMSGPLSVRVTVPHAAWAMVRVRGDWVLTQQHGVPLVSVSPLALFSDETLAHMQARR